MLDLCADTAEALQIDATMAGQLDIAQQQVKGLQGALHQALQLLEAVHWSYPVIAQTIEQPLQLQALARVCIGDENAQGLVYHGRTWAIGKWARSMTLLRQ